LVCKTCELKFPVRPPVPYVAPPGAARVEPTPLRAATQPRIAPTSPPPERPPEARATARKATVRHQRPPFLSSSLPHALPGSFRDGGADGFGGRIHPRPRRIRMWAHRICILVTPSFKGKTESIDHMCARIKLHTRLDIVNTKISSTQIKSYYKP
jgi:hypothetical protein